MIIETMLVCGTVVFISSLGFTRWLLTEQEGNPREREEAEAIRRERKIWGKILAAHTSLDYERRRAADNLERLRAAGEKLQRRDDGTSDDGLTDRSAS